MGDAEFEDIPPEKLEMLKKAFENFSQGKDFISPDNVGGILRMMEVKYNAASLKELIIEIDEDGSGQIEFPEFICLFKKFEEEGDAEALEKELKEAFRLYDKEGEGSIPTSCLREIIKEIDAALTDEELDGMIEEIDEDGSGTVDFSEFMEMMTG
ncbi:unnamed protein product [Allacma fusca]|uniref:EF-hand domain-containing protein n=1 Tax=Allacma fusca TaxID=39272 RepID=A0A8J2L3S6_9HEXA|nr:unnamed protein product [Allacma fusca]